MRDDLIARLRGCYTVQVNDGAGPLNGSTSVTRIFDVPPINIEAANEIERLRAALAAQGETAPAPVDEDRDKPHDAGLPEHLRNAWRRGSAAAPLPAADTCTWPGCRQPALCASGNFGGGLVCSDHFKITNGHLPAAEGLERFRLDCDWPESARLDPKPTMVKDSAGAWVRFTDVLTALRAVAEGRK